MLTIRFIIVNEFIVDIDPCAASSMASGVCDSEARSNKTECVVCSACQAAQSGPKLSPVVSRCERVVLVPHVYDSTFCFDWSLKELDDVDSNYYNKPKYLQRLPLLVLLLLLLLLRQRA